MMLSRDAIHDRVDYLNCETWGLSKERVDIMLAASNPKGWDAWFDIAAEIMGADWRDLDADWWRGQWERGYSPLRAIELWLEETA